MTDRQPIYGTGDVAAGWDPSGLTLRDYGTPGQWVRITGRSSDWTKYKFVSVVPKSDGTWEDSPIGSGFPYCDDTNVLPLRDVRNIPGVNDGEIVWAWPDPTMPGFRFRWDGPIWFRITSGTTTGPYTGVVQASVVGGFTDGVPTVTVSGIQRAPYNDPGSSTGVAPDIPPNTIIPAWPTSYSPSGGIRYLCGPWGGRQKVLVPGIVVCNDGTLTVTYRYLTGVDLKLTPTTDVP
jgi:hypothetical protein